MDTIDVESNDGWPPEPRGPRRMGGGGGRRGGRGLRPAAVIAGAMVLLSFVLVVILGITGRLGVAQVADDQVAVLVNYTNGNKEVIDTPGFRLYLPFVQELFLFDRSSQEFKMEGLEFVDDNHVPRLTVRANDGSNFWFEELTILYEIVPGDADRLLEDSGVGDGFKQNWIKAYARSVLRDEFGRYSAVEAADPTQYTSAAQQSRDRLNELLGPHGIRVTRVITPKPKFDAEYEKAIEDRKEADQEVERLRAKSEQLDQERAQRLSAVEKEKQIEMQALEGDLTKELLAAEQQAILITQAAKAYSIDKKKKGEGELAQMTARARGLEAKYTKEAEGLTQKAKALEERGEVIVREALIEKLSRIRFTFLPYSRDPSPKRLEHVNRPDGAAGQVDGSIGGGQ